MFGREINKILIWGISIAIVLFLPPSAAADTWARGNIVGLCKGTEIRTGPGKGYRVHTIVPENDWAVKLIDGPRYADGEEWWDTSRKAAGDPSGGTGWVSKRQATACKTVPPTQPPPTQPSPARIVLVSGLVLSRSQAVPGEWVNASFRVKNIGGQTFRARYFGVKGRGPGDSDYSFHWIENFTLAPGQEFGYDANRTFERIGSHWFTPNYSVDGSTWADVKWQDGRTSYVTIQIVPPASPTPVPLPSPTRQPPTAVILPTATLPPTPRATTPAPVTLDYICGYSTAGIIQSGFFLQEGTFYPYIIACSTGEKIGWGPRGGWGQQSYVQINNPVIVALSPPVHLNDGTIISREIVRWSDYIRISSCADCGRNNAPPPTTPAPRPTTPVPRPTTPAPEPIITPVPVPPPPPTPGELSIVVAINLSNTTPQVGQKITATFTVRNVGGSPITIRRMVAGARGPNARSAPNNGWSAPNVDFDAVTNLVLSPGETYTYRTTRSFSTPGEYFAEPAWLTPTGEWEGIPPYQRVWFTVRDIPTITPTPASPILQVRFPLGKDGQDPMSEGFDRWYSFGGQTGVTRISGICLGSQPINKLTHAGEDWARTNWDSIPNVEVHAIAEGTLAENALADWSPGRALLIYHESLGVWAMYGHLSDSKDYPLRVRNKGERVRGGQVIGYVYDDGDNSHLHLEIRSKHPLTLSCVSGTPENTWGYGYVRNESELDKSGYVNPTKLFERFGVRLPRTPIYQTAGTVTQGEKQTAGTVPVTPNQARVDFALRWPGSTLELVVVDPQGRQVDEQYPGAQWLREATRLVLTVQQPLPGAWSMSVVGKQVSLPAEPYEIIVSATVEKSTSVPMSFAGVVVLGFTLLLLPIVAGVVIVMATRETSPAVPAAALYRLEGSHAYLQTVMSKPILFLGRDPQGNVRLNDSQVPACAQILCQGNQFILSALDHKNAVLINGKNVKQQWLRDGDRIHIGNTELLFRVKGKVPFRAPTSPVASAPVVGEAWLSVSRGTQVGTRFILHTPTTRLGRDSSSDIVLQDSQVSRRHAEIRRESNGYVLYDLRSTNGTFVNGKRIASHLLRTGDELGLGQTTLVFQQNIQPRLERS